MTVDGHDEMAIDRAIEELWSTASSSPKALVAKTVKGKGVPFMEHNNAWHYTRLDADTYRRALAAIDGKPQ
jgi:transketolase